ncbi:MAG: hypothetical protein AB7O38_24880, partial [Pirellulaceae bacterium]
PPLGVVGSVRPKYWPSQCHTRRASATPATGGASATRAEITGRASATPAGATEVLAEPVPHAPRAPARHASTLRN